MYLYKLLFRVLILERIIDPKVLQDQSNKLKLWALAWGKSRSNVVEFDMCVLKHASVDLHKNSYFKIFISGTLVIPNGGNVSQMGYCYPSKPGLLNRSRPFIFFNFYKRNQRKTTQLWFNVPICVQWHFRNTLRFPCVLFLRHDSKANLFVYIQRHSLISRHLLH